MSFDFGGIEFGKIEISEVVVESSLEEVVGRIRRSLELQGAPHDLTEWRGETRKDKGVVRASAFYTVRRCACK